MKPTVALLSIALSLPAAAGEVRAPTLFSKTSPELKLVELDNADKGLLTHWRGRLLLTGKLVVAFRRVPREQNELFPQGAAYFEPDAPSLAKLPAALSNSPAVPSVIELRKTPREVLTPLIGSTAATAVLQGSRERYEYLATIVISSLSTSIDCDRRSFSARYERIFLRGQRFDVAATASNLRC